MKYVRRMVRSTPIVLAMMFSAACHSPSQSPPTPTPITPPRVESNNASAIRPKPDQEASQEAELTLEQANELSKPSTPVEYQLAVMDAGHLVPKNDSTVKRFRKLLVSLRKATGYSYADIRQKNMVALTEVRKRTGLPITFFGFTEVSLDLVRRYPRMDYNAILAGMTVNSELFNDVQR